MEEAHNLDTHEAVASVFASHFMAMRFRTSHENVLFDERLEYVYVYVADIVDSDRAASSVEVGAWWRW